MTRKEIIQQLKTYFSVADLVCDHTYAKFGAVKSWQFLHTELLHTILVLRTQILGVPMIVNYGSKHQRGLRCNICQLVKDKTVKNELYLSSHINGAAIDFDAKGLTAEQSRQRIKEKADLLPFPIRLEKAVGWVHIDVYDDPTTDAKIVEFNG